MSEQRWMVRVNDKDYGPADFQTLVEWKEEGRVIPENLVRAANADFWTTAADIPGLFAQATIGNPDPLETPTHHEGRGVEREPLTEQSSAISAGRTRENVETEGSATAEGGPARGFFGILGQTCRIFGRNFSQFICLTILVVLPSVCAQLASVWMQDAPGKEVDARTLVLGAFAFCMFVLSVVLWPIYIGAVQIISAEGLGGRRLGFLAALNEAVKFWPRVAVLCIFVYGVFFLLTVFALGIALMLAAGTDSIPVILFAMALLFLQVWMFSRFFINVMFWQQFAVLENTGVFESLRESRRLARGRGDLPWYQSPWWRGAMIVSIWIAAILAIALYSNWSAWNQEWNVTMTTRDPQLLLQKITAIEQARGFNVLSFSLGLVQKLFQPLLGIAFVVLYFDAKKVAGDE